MNASPGLFLTVLLALPLPAQSVYRLQPFQQRPGQVLTMRATSDSTGGSMVVQRGDVSQTGVMGVKRERTYERTIGGSPTTPSLQYRILSDRISTTVGTDGTPRTRIADAALTGLSVLGFRDATRQWRLYLRGRTASNDEAVALAELEAYENRSWFLDSAVKVGAEWVINPGFIRHLTERDVDQAEINATAKLREVSMIDGERTAVIDLTVKTMGSKDNPIAGTSSGLSIALTGTLHVALDTMLDKKLVMTGGFTTVAREGGVSTTVKMPYNATVTKTLGR